MEVPRTIRWSDGKVILLDQRKLPLKEVYITCHDPRQIAKRIRNMTVRGAPAIGVAGAMGIALAALRSRASDYEDLMDDLRRASKILKATRPTAINLSWAIDRMLMKAKAFRGDVEVLRRLLIQEAQRMAEEDIEANKALSDLGEELLEDGDSILTYCNAGALATIGWGTALGIVRSAVRRGKRIHVYACETRPLLQGSRLTTYELSLEGIPVTLITDNAAAYCMNRGLVKKVIVGADRIAANGDVANKIGTYALAILARHHGIPFYVAAPTSTIDPSKPSGASIPIEMRDPNEVKSIGGRRLAPETVEAMNPAFDVTPSELVTAIITEKGILWPPFQESIRKLLKHQL
ncbi:S-methyl-5-thioribose-1-phosphate isomerase [Candidatus Bathyarchaeota archaeon]|nr:S-methyl-5-thioribose-1-phosphate isomerase [Candidatus Bathyarchaeota archaeon]